MRIEILGRGCKNCTTLEARTREVLASLGVDADIEKVTDDVAIASRGVMRTPGLVVDDELVVSGTVPTAERLRALLAPKAAGAPTGT
jgi:small redox-active disulfide protein 2